MFACVGHWQRLLMMTPRGPVWHVYAFFAGTTVACPPSVLYSQHYSQFIASPPIPLHMFLCVCRMYIICELPPFFFSLSVVIAQIPRLKYELFPATANDVPLKFHCEQGSPVSFPRQLPSHCVRTLRYKHGVQTLRKIHRCHQKPIFTD